MKTKPGFENVTKIITKLKQRRDDEEITELSKTYEDTGQLQLIVELLLDIRKLLENQRYKTEK